MPRSLPVPVVLLFLALPLAFGACGSGSDLSGPSSAALPSSPSAPPFEPAPPPAAWADDGCTVCHGEDGGGGGGPNIQCTSYERLDTHLRPITTSHAGGAFPALTDGELLDLVAFLRTADCPEGGASSGIPATHTESEDGVLHHPDYERNLTTCTACHGANLEGSDFAPSCASCHSGDGFDDDEDDESERDDD